VAHPRACGRRRSGALPLGQHATAPLDQPVRKSIGSILRIAGRRRSCSRFFTFVSSVERGERNLSLASLLRLAEDLEMNPAELVDGLRWTQDASGSRA
jgi:hypothetical protein